MKRLSKKTKEYLWTAAALIIATVMMAMMLSVAGCSIVTYESDGEWEKFSMKTFLKTVDGASAMRTPDIFAMKIDSTANTNVVEDIAAIMRFYSNPLQP